jgi:hypothetical protein
MLDNRPVDFEKIAASLRMLLLEDFIGIIFLREFGEPVDRI